MLCPDVLQRVYAGKLFLLRRQNEQGFWRDYALPPGSSEAWTTSVVGWALSQPPVIPASVPALYNAAEALHRCRKHSGWGYNTKTAVDADSTAWTLRLLALLDDLRGIDPNVFLAGFVSPNGDTRTFQNSLRFGTWAKNHSDVAPLIGMLLIECGGDLAYIAQLRRACLTSCYRNRLWEAFWWTTESYAISRNLEFLEASGGIPREVRCLARDWLTSKPKPRSAFEAAQDLNVAVTLSLDITNYAQALLEFQLEKGNWPPSPVLLVPNQGMCAEQSRSTYADVHCLMTTAMATLALGQLVVSAIRF